MRGKIIYYNHAEGKGLILSAQGQHAFEISHWLSDSAPRINQTVETSAPAGRIAGVRRVDKRVLVSEQLQCWCRQVTGFWQRVASGADDRRWQAPVVGWSLLLLLVLTWFQAPAIEIRTGSLVRYLSPAAEMRELLDPLTRIAGFGLWSLISVMLLIDARISGRTGSRLLGITCLCPLLWLLLTLHDLNEHRHYGLSEDTAQQVIWHASVTPVLGLVWGFWVLLLLSLLLLLWDGCLRARR